jgi:hypothetical protein
MRLEGRLVPVRALTASQRNVLYNLMNRQYENVQPAVFSADLDEKQWVILVLDPATDEVCGFSTQVVLDAEVVGRRISVLFSGDTIVAREHWGDAALAHIWGRLALSLIDRLAGVELYWFLISKGYRTYRFLPVFFREFYPRHDCATPAWAKAVIDALGRSRYPATYDQSIGVVRASTGKDRLRPGVDDRPGACRSDPHVRFFLQCNPGHAWGDELCCIAPLSPSNFTTAAHRVIGPEARRLELGV